MASTTMRLARNRNILNHRQTHGLINASKVYPTHSARAYAKAVAKALRSANAAGSAAKSSPRAAAVAAKPNPV